MRHVQHCAGLSDGGHRSTDRSVRGVDDDSNRGRALAHEKCKLDVLKIVVIDAQHCDCVVDGQATQRGFAIASTVDVVSTPTGQLIALIIGWGGVDDHYSLTCLREVPHDSAGHSVKAEDDDVIFEGERCWFLHQFSIQARGYRRISAVSRRSNCFAYGSHMRLLTSSLAGAALIAGFGLAQATDNRTAGGVVLLAGAAACGYLWWRDAGMRGALLSEGVVFVAFVGSHALARPIGAWPSVGVAAAATVALSYAATKPRGLPSIRSATS